MKLTSPALPTLLIIGSLFLFAACSKEKVSPPSTSQSSATSDEALQPGENLTDSVVIGTYTITKFIDSSVDNTAQFSGYTFEFRANHDFVAHFNGKAYKGRWRTNAAETKMAINISGTPELDDLDGNDWNIAKLTDHSIVLRRKGPDKVIFKLQ